MAKKGYHVILACRSVSKAEKAAEDIESQCEAGGLSASLDILRLDLADLSSVQDFAGSFAAKYDTCDVLLNNAGIMAPPSRELTADGFELQIGTNHLGHFLLTSKLMPQLQAAERARIVNVSSIAHTFGAVDLNNLQSEGFFGYTLQVGNPISSRIPLSY
eukprot:gene9611-11385_t